jgi:hypothetical protein
METLIDSNKEVGLDVNTEKTKYMLLSRHQNAGKYHDIKIASRCFENVAKLRYLGMAVTNQNLIQEEIHRKLNSCNACYQQSKSFCLLVCCLKNIKIRLYKTIILPMVLYGCET